MAVVPSTELSLAVLRRVSAHHAFEACVEQLATAIRLGVYPHGSTLPPERDLAVRLGVSRATLREAISGLRAAGLVRTRRGRGGGTVVSHSPSAPTPIELDGRLDRLRDSLVFRRVVEPGAAHLAANRDLAPAQRELLSRTHAEVAAATGRDLHRQADSRFHLAVAAVTESPQLVAAVTTAQASLHEMLSAIPVLDVNIEHSARQHKALLTAILRGEATKARRVMESHCDDTAALLRGLLT